MTRLSPLLKPLSKTAIRFRFKLSEEELSTLIADGTFPPPDEWWGPIPIPLWKPSTLQTFFTSYRKKN